MSGSSFKTVGTVTTTTSIRQLSDGNPAGAQLGQSPTDLLGFYGAAPIAQPSGQGQVAATRGTAAGVIATLNGAVASPSAVGTLTTSEKTMTMMTAAGSNFALAAGDLVFVNKPTSQAGLGVGNVRVSAANTLAVNFSNPTAATITPTATETYSVAVKRMAPVAPLVVQTATLTPAAVAPNTAAEQTFAVSGLVAGSPVWVNKPSLTAGIGIAGARVSAAGTLALNFVNVTAGTITPPVEGYIVGNFQLPFGDASSTWLQTAGTSDQQQSQLGNAVRGALVNIGMIAGA